MSPTELTSEQCSAYLSRIGYADPVRVDIATLRSLQRHHLRTVPFENLDIPLGRLIDLDVEHIVRKVVNDRRGGFCYELNGGFGALLDALGFEVALLEARVYNDGDVGIHYDHLTLAVSIGSERHLTDVGFGAFSDEPLDLNSRDDQPDDAGVFRILDRADGWLDISQDGKLSYRLSVQPHALLDFQPGCTYHQTSPDSHFTKGSVCSMRTLAGRTTLAGTTLIQTVGGSRTSTELTPDEVGSALANRFGIVLGDAELARLGQPSAVARRASLAVQHEA